MRRLDRQHEIEQAFESGLAEHHLPGAALALIRDGAITRILTAGHADRESLTPVTPDTVFSLQSISKSFAAWAVMMLVEEGRIDLDAPIGAYLRSWRLPPAEFDADGVTVRRVLCHHAGLSGDLYTTAPATRTDLRLIDTLNGEVPPLTEEQDAYWRFWNLGRDWPLRLIHPPGTMWLYANGGYGLLELMLEDVTGMPFADFVKQRVLDPLGLAATYDPPGDQRLASAYGAGGVRIQRYRFIGNAAAGLYASISDLASFTCAVIALGQPGSVLSEASAQEMRKPHGLATASNEIQFEAGLGCLTHRENGVLNVHHSGGTMGWRSIYSVFPETGDGICMLVNSDQSNPYWIGLVRSWRALVTAT